MDQNGGALVDKNIPQWKRELIARRKALGRTLSAGNTTVKLTCPSIVAAVRQPEATTAGESVTQQRCIAGAALQASSSLDQNQADFHPGPSVTVGNMRLLDKCMNVNNELVISGSDIQNFKQSEVDSSAFQYIHSHMGEEKLVTNLKNKSLSNRPTMEKINIKISKQYSTKKENYHPSKNGEDYDCLSDSSEELQYGPGIVNRLRSRYLSMTLRENQKRGIRPSLSNMRRATSLENMLDDDNNTNKTIQTNNRTHLKNDNSTVLNKITNLTNTSKHSGINRSTDSMKRARSMDTLLKSDNRSSVVQANITVRPKSFVIGDKAVNVGTNNVVSIINEDLIIVENSSVDGNTNSLEGACQGVRCRKTNTEKDLPPPDVVKQTLKLFENSLPRKSKTALNKKQNNSKFIYSNNTNNIKFTSDRQKLDLSGKPVLSPKPILSPEKLRQNRSIKMNSPVKVKSLNSNTTANNRPTPKHYSEALSTSPSIVNDIIPVSSRTKSSRCISPLVTAIPLSEQETHLTTSSKILNIGNKSESISSSNEEECGSSDEANFKIPKPVSQTALENIRKGGTSTQFKFSSDNQPSKIKSYLPGSHIQATNSVLVLSPTRQSLPPTATVAPLKPTESLVSPPKQIGVIRPIVSTKSNHKPPAPNQPAILTDQEIEKNLINRVKSIEQPVSKVVVAIKSLPVNEVGSISSEIVLNKDLAVQNIQSEPETKVQGLWDKKPWHQNQNTMVFNFSNRKDVPDYIENDGLILKGQRDRPRPGEGGIIFLNNAEEESSTDADSEDWISDPPSPCDVTFEGDNVLINGKSNLSRSPKQRKLRIHFNDEATTMFEYPSEASLVECDGSPSPAIMPLDTSNSSPAMPLGGSLGSYTPRLCGQGSVESFQLGVTRSTPASTSHTSGSTKVTSEDPHLKPAPPESIVTWSEDSAPDLLF